MKILKYIFIAFIWLESGHSALSQYYLKARSDSISLESDSVLLFVDKYRGAVEWWVNPDLMDYNWMLLTSTNDTLGVRIDNSAYYRATITEGTCNPVMSDTVYLIEKLTITGSNQFTVDSMGGVFLLPTGIYGVLVEYDAYCWYGNDEEKNRDPFGALYNGYAVNTGKLCPAGWHVPHSTEVAAMERYLVAKGFNYDGTITEYGNKIAKALASPAYWISSFYRGSIGNDKFPEKMNATCFSALPGGCRWGKYMDIADGRFVGFGEVGYWWQSDILTHFDLHHFSDALGSSQASGEQVGLSVRCVKDQ